MKKCIIFVFALLILSSVIISSTAATLNDYSYFVPGVNSMGDFENIRFWERLNHTQSYVFPAYTYYDDYILGELSSQITYLPISIPRYITTPATYGEDASVANLDRLANVYWYNSNISNDSELSMQSSIQLDNITRTDEYNGQMTYSYSPTLAGTSLSNMNILLVGDIYSYNFSHPYNDQTNNVDITGLVIANPSTSNMPCVVYLNGVMKWAGSASGGGETPRGTQTFDGYILLHPGNSVRIDETLLEGQGEVEAKTTCFSGAIMVRHGNNYSSPVLFIEEFNDYFSDIITYSDTNLQGLSGGGDGRFGGANIANSFNAQYWGGYSSNPDYGQLDITNNGVYSTKYYSSVKVSVPQEISWGGMFDWVVNSAGAFMSFEIAPGWSIGIIMSIIVGLAVAIWAIRVFMGG